KLANCCDRGLLYLATSFHGHLPQPLLDNGPRTQLTNRRLDIKFAGRQPTDLAGFRHCRRGNPGTSATICVVEEREQKTGEMAASDSRAGRGRYLGGAHICAAANQSGTVGSFVACSAVQFYCTRHEPPLRVVVHSISLVRLYDRRNVCGWF